jgi:hypothetical protein
MFSLAPVSPRLGVIKKRLPEEFSSFLAEWIV